MRTLRLNDGFLIDWSMSDEPGADHVFTKLDGWYGSPVRLGKADLWQDGTHMDPLWRAGREMTIGGFHRLRCHPDPPAEVDRLKRALSGAFRSGAVNPGFIRVSDEAGVILESTGVQLDGPPKFVDYGDLFSWELQLVSDDPYLYEVGPTRLAVHPVGQGTGLNYPLFDDELESVTTGFLEWGGEVLSPGGVAVNLGNATAYPVLDVDGTFPAGFRVALSGDKDQTLDPGRGRWEVTYLGEVFPGQPVTVDFGGRVWVAGVDRTWAVADTFWGGVAPNGGRVTFELDPISAGYGTATLTLRSTYL